MGHTTANTVDGGLSGDLASASYQGLGPEPPTKAESTPTASVNATAAGRPHNPMAGFG